MTPATINILPFNQMNTRIEEAFHSYNSNTTDGEAFIMSFTWFSS
jgi:hypothetical protein